jgi:hypothetical protein
MQSLWCYQFSVLALFLQIISSKSKWFHTLALVVTEITFCTSLGVCIAYWPFEAHNFVRNYMEQGMRENYEYANAFFVHAFPMVSSIFNVLFFKVVYLKRHAKIPFFVVLIYLPVNYYGRYLYGKAVYY